MAFSLDQWAAVGFLIVALIVIAIVLVLKFLKFVILGVILLLIGYAFYAGWIHI